jgi:hypothetical protein
MPSSTVAPQLSRRAVLSLAPLGFILHSRRPALASTPLKIYQQRGYQLEVPSAWERIDKAGADVLFEDATKRSSSIGVTANLVRVKTLESFGSLDEIGSKLIEAERKKESTLSIVLLSSKSRTSPSSGALLYEYEYVVDSTRGKKRIINVVSIYDSKLYIYNGAYKCESSGKEAQEEGEEGTSCEGPVEILRASSASFDVTG